MGLFIMAKTFNCHTFTLYSYPGRLIFDKLIDILGLPISVKKIKLMTYHDKSHILSMRMIYVQMIYHNIS
jgi:hypothetical protein